MNEKTYNLDLDAEFINHLAVSESVQDIQAEQISAQLLVDKTARDIFAWQVNHIKEHGQPASGPVLQDQFPRWNFEEPQSAIKDLIDRLRERFVRNSGREAVRRIADMTVVDPLEMAKTMIEEGRSLAELTTRRGEMMGSGDYTRAMTAYDRRLLEGKGPSLGFDELDQHFFGQRGVTFLMAAPKTYKSWFTINAMAKNIETGSFPYLYSLELPAEESDMRLRCMAANVPYWKYLHRKLDNEDREKLRKASEIMDENGAFRVEKPRVGERGVTQMVERAINAGADTILIDQLQYVETNGDSLGALNNTGDYFNVVNELRNYSDSIPIFVVHQFNRSVMSSKEMPEMQQGKGSSAIEEVATLALGLWANKEMRANGVVQLGTLASRNYSYKAWDVDVELSRGTSFTIMGESREDDDE